MKNLPEYEVQNRRLSDVDEADIRSQCQIGKSQAKMIDICNRAIVHAVRTDDRRIQMAAAAKRIKTDIW